MKILFVCTGNTCRSVMAENIFNNLNTVYNTVYNISAFSAGISAIPGSKTSYNASQVVNKYLNIDISNREAVQLNQNIMNEADLVLTMTGRIRDILKMNFRNKSNRIFTLNEYIGQEDDVIDPYGGDILIYTQTYNYLRNSINLLIGKLKEDKGVF